MMRMIMGMQRFGKMGQALMTISFATSAMALVSGVKATDAKRCLSTQNGAATTTEELETLRSENARLKNELNIGEMEKLKRENDQLVRALAPVPEDLAPLDVFGLWKRDDTELTRELDRAFGGMGLFGGLVGSLAKGAFSAARPLMEASQKDIDRVRDKVESVLVADLGEGAKCGEPFQHSYASSNVNGHVTKSVAFFAMAQDPKGKKDREVQCLATIRGDAQSDAHDTVYIDHLLLDGKKMDLPKLTNE